MNEINLNLILITSIFITLVLMGIILIIKKWNRLSGFFYIHYTIFKILFLVLYFFEQAIFIMIFFIFKEQSIEVYQLLQSLFALVVLTTVTFQGLMMDIINKKETNKLQEYKESFGDKMSKIRRHYEKQIMELRKYIAFLEGRDFFLKN